MEEHRSTGGSSVGEFSVTPWAADQQLDRLSRCQEVFLDGLGMIGGVSRGPMVLRGLTYLRYCRCRLPVRLK